MQNAHELSLGFPLLAPSVLHFIHHCSGNSHRTAKQWILWLIFLYLAYYSFPLIRYLNTLIFYLNQLMYITHDMLNYIVISRGGSIVVQVGSIEPTYSIFYFFLYLHIEISCKFVYINKMNQFFTHWIVRISGEWVYFHLVKLSSNLLSSSCKIRTLIFWIY